MNTTRVPFTLLLSFILMLSSAQLAIGEELHIYYSNDMHGKVEPCG